MLEFHSHSNYNKADEVCEAALTLQDALDGAVSSLRQFNKREAIFGQTVSEYEVLTQTLRDFAPFHRLWTMCSEFELAKSKWLTGPFSDLDAAEVMRTMEGWWKDCLSLQKKFKVCSPSRTAPHCT